MLTKLIDICEKKVKHLNLEYVENNFRLYCSLIFNSTKKKKMKVKF